MTTRASILRYPSVAGQFYPADSQALRSMVDELLSQASQAGPEPVALISPHAGYVYSGSVAAQAFKQAAGVNYATVVILGTNHTDPLARGFAIWPEGAWKTPLGDCVIDAELAQALMAANAQITFQRNAHLSEHSIEVQLPFLQRVLPGVKFVPLSVAEPTLKNCEALAQTLAAALKERHALVVASSDLSHYPRYEEAARVDGDCLAAILSLDPRTLQAAIDRHLGEGVADLHTCMCGEGPIMATMLYARAVGAKRADVIQYANSGDAGYGDKRRVVGYAAVRFAR